MRDDLNAIPVFVTVVESGNFASAAAILHVTRSAVGKTIARLEARLGVALFQRTTRRQLLTEEGEQFYHQCREALARIREAEEALQRGKGEVQGRLRISLPVLFGQRCVAPVLFRLSQRYPLLKLELHYSDRQVNLLEEGLILRCVSETWPIPGRYGRGRWGSMAWCCARRWSTCAASRRRRPSPG